MVPNFIDESARIYKKQRNPEQTETGTIKFSE